ncbi:2-isopropylmalate synthase [Rhodococcus sp. HNM0563]|uniref:LeuA family protein n=1 Tax=Rhodococcus sp. HNM0563 TaxID=2716339 RepID=UPI00169C3D19|nr:LeuA family protein [Rhodococcus sp. HNM0563]NLU63559.1 2-isopropylmalate synthase [Rhodococcus sp. HNM0563]
MRYPDELFDWSSLDPAEHRTPVDYLFFDETLRDGIQAPYVLNPPLEAKMQFVDHMVRSGIRAADLGFPGASPAAKQECIEIMRYVRDSGHHLITAFAGRTHPTDIAAICDVAHEAQAAVEAYAFVGVSPIRQHVEDWSVDSVVERLRDSALQCRRANVAFVLVLEDTTRCTPEVLGEIYAAAADLGVDRITVCDTVGAASPASTRALVRWSIEFFESRSCRAQFDWHGHNDRGLALINALVALEAGCDRVHGTALGIGERAGNTAIDQLIVNRSLQHGEQFDLEAVRTYGECVATMLGIEIPANYPALGNDVFKTSAGVHASAILKAANKGKRVLMDNVYSSVPASLLGRHQEVLIDRASGASNVQYWLSVNGYSASDDVIRDVLTLAKAADRPLTDEQIGRIVAQKH